jgi:hypothetical protein
MKNQPCTVVLLLLFIISCAPQEKKESETMIDEHKTKEVLEHHWHAFQQNNLEETMKDYTEESVLITPDVTYRGLAEIRTNFEKAFAAFPKDSTSMILNKSISLRDVGYILWQAKTPSFELIYATDTFIIQEGKIIRQTYAGLVQ